MSGDKVVFSVPWFDVVARMADGSAAPYYVIRTCDHVTVLAATAEGSLLLVRQFRPAVGRETLELPSGHVEDGELPEAAARRELAEETGYEAERFELLGALAPDPGRQANKLWCFYAAGATQIRSPVLREEGVELVSCEQRDLIRRVSEGEIDHAPNLAVLLLATIKGKLAAGPGTESSR
jgi:ADP-ribose pyrophosphatase